MKVNDIVTQADLDSVYDEIKTPYKYGTVVISTGDEGLWMLIAKVFFDMEINGI